MQPAPGEKASGSRGRRASRHRAGQRREVGARRPCPPRGPCEVPGAHGAVPSMTDARESPRPHGCTCRWGRDRVGPGCELRVTSVAAMVAFSSCVCPRGEICPRALSTEAGHSWGRRERLSLSGAVVLGAPRAQIDGDLVRRVHNNNRITGEEDVLGPGSYRGVFTS